MGKMYWIIEIRTVDGDFKPPERFFYPATLFAKDEALADAQERCKASEKAFHVGEEMD